MYFSVNSLRKKKEKEKFRMQPKKIGHIKSCAEDKEEGCNGPMSPHHVA